jgi:enhancer of mRNA-decapping protein 3
VITRAFRNGIPLKKPDMEITITLADILNLELIPAYNLGNSSNSVSKPTPIKTNGRNDQKISPPTDTQQRPTKSPTKPFIPAAVETRMASSKPIEIPPRGFVGTNVSFARSSGEKKQKNRKGNQNSTFNTPINDPLMDEDFDFEKNLALFDKKAIFNELDNNQKPDLLKQTPRNGKYRHDENVLVSEPIRYRRIEVDATKQSKPGDLWTTDDGYVLPAISLLLRREIEQKAEACGLNAERQRDAFARAVAEISLVNILGGPQRMVAKNEHQWPNVAIICDEPLLGEQSELGLAVGRILASQGLKVSVFTRIDTHLLVSKDLALFRATGSIITTSCHQLPTPDLIILACGAAVSEHTSNYISEMRAPILALDPPARGLNIPVKYSIFPILPIDKTSESCGKIFIANLTIPDQCFRDCGVGYKSFFGHKVVIPIYMKD